MKTAIILKDAERRVSDFLKEYRAEPGTKEADAANMSAAMSLALNYLCKALAPAQEAESEGREADAALLIAEGAAQYENFVARLSAALTD